MSLARIPPDYYAGVGRVAVAATELEVYIAELAAEALGIPATRHFGDLAGTPGQALRKLREAVERRPDIEALGDLGQRAQSLMLERHKFVHGLLVHNASGRVILQRPADGSMRRLPETHELVDLIRRLRALTEEVSEVWQRLLAQKDERPADSVQTEEG